MPKSFLAELLSCWCSPSLYHCLRLFCPRSRTLHFSLLNFMMYLLAHCSSLSTVDGSSNISRVDCLPQFYEFAEGVSVLLPRLLTKIVKKTDSSISHTRTQFVISRKLDCKPLTTVLWDQRSPSIQSIQQQICRNNTWHCIEALLKSNETTSTVAKRNHLVPDEPQQFFCNILDPGPWQAVKLPRQQVWAADRCCLSPQKGVSDHSDISLPLCDTGSTLQPGVASHNTSLRQSGTFLVEDEFYLPGTKLCFYDLYTLPWKDDFSSSFKECDKKVWGQVKLIYFWIERYKRKYRVIS